MDDSTVSNQNPEKDFNKLDLSQLQGFSFGTQWSQDKNSKGGQRPEERSQRRERSDGDRPSSPTDARRDRRGFRKPAGDVAPGAPTAPVEGGEQPPRNDQPRNDRPADGRREFRGQGGQGGPRRDGPAGGNFRGGPRRDFREGGNQEGGDRRDFRGPRRDQQPVDRGPYISPFFNVTFYPEDTSFGVLAKAVRSSCRTYELFEIAKVIVDKNDRFIAVIQRRNPDAPRGQTMPPLPPGETAAPVAAPAAAKVSPIAISLLDGLPFETEDAVIAHVMEKHLGAFFDSAEVEVEAPKGNYQVINRCTITGELLSPPNYHRYNQIVQQHHAAKIQRMSLESYRGRIESVRDPELIKQWQDKMKKITRYTWKQVAEGQTAQTFDSLEEARNYLLLHNRDKLVRSVESARFNGKNLATLPQGEIRRALEGALERQRRFPLDTANALRGRLRREGLTIFKKGSKGISYVCSVKRKFRVPGQVFSDSIGGLIAFIEANPMIKASALASKFLGIQAPMPTPAPTPVAAVVAAAAETPSTAPAEDAPAAESAAPASAPEVTAAPVVETPVSAPLSAEDQARLARMQGDLRWLVTEGYVTEFSDGRLFAPPAVTEARKQEIDPEHDPENFPEVPVTSAPFAAAAPVETAPAASETPSPEVAAASEAPASDAEKPKSE